ncbi:phosphotransferase [Kribbella sp. NBC_01245]|uniref:phosphotransferase n=1 Tax=Kribbella sp. NBC_01245 TaxID=2903578 RepID=UPI002E2CAE4F|nr:phosphotransferase [Kribbella sp. NBC_01245]
MSVDAVVRKFGAERGEAVAIGFSSATVVRLERRKETLYYKAGAGVSAECDRLLWLGATDFPSPLVRDRGDDWMLTSELPGRDTSQPWPVADRPAVIAAMAAGLRALHQLDVADCPFESPFPGTREVVTHGDFCAPNVFVDPETLRFTGMLDVDSLGVGPRYVDLALMYNSLSNGLNPQYDGQAAAFVQAYGGDPLDSRITYYIDLANAR